jgi:hypothetical protein
VKEAMRARIVKALEVFMMVFPLLLVSALESGSLSRSRQLEMGSKKEPAIKGSNYQERMKLLSNYRLSREIVTFAKRGKVNITGVICPWGLGTIRGQFHRIIQPYYE